MIKLYRPNKPQRLIEEESQLILEYKSSKKAVWRKDYIIEKLFESSFGKCAYCENKLNWKKDLDYQIELDEDKQSILVSIHNNEENNFIHIDHFEARKHDESDLKVVEWENLIPSCPTCNYKKGAHNVNQYPIINPYIENPKDFFQFYGHELCGKAGVNQIKAWKTITLLGLRERQNKLFRYLSTSISTSLFKINFDLQSAVDAYQNGDYSYINDIVNRFEILLMYGLPHEKYSSLSATFILNHPYFANIKQVLLQNGFYDNFLNLEKTLIEIKYDL